MSDRGASALAVAVFCVALALAASGIVQVWPVSEAREVDRLVRQE